MNPRPLSRAPLKEQITDLTRRVACLERQLDEALGETARSRDERETLRRRLDAYDHFMRIIQAEILLESPAPGRHGQAEYQRIKTTVDGNEYYLAVRPGPVLDLDELRASVKAHNNGGEGRPHPA